MNTIDFFIFFFTRLSLLNLFFQMSLPMCFLNEDLLNHILTYVDTSDIINVISGNKELAKIALLSAFSDKEIEIASGLSLVRFCLWIKRHGVQKIKTLEIRNVDCKPYSYIKKEYIQSLEALQDIHVKKMVFVKMTFGDTNLIPANVEHLYVNKCFPVKMTWMNEIKNLRTLSLNGYHDDISDMKDIGLKNLSVKQLSTNYLRTMPEMIEFLENSVRNENLNEFSFEMPIEDRRTNEPLLKKKIQDVYPKTTIAERIGTTRFYW